MTTAVIPTAQEAISGVKDLGMVALGMIAGHAVIATTKKDSPLINGGLAVGGLGLYLKAKNPMVKMIGLGVSAYGTIKLVNNATKTVASAETTEGLNGLLPESVKSMIRKYIPTLSGMDEFAGTEGLDADIDNLSLDDESMRGDDTVMYGIENETPVAGLGKAYDLAA